MSATQIQPFYLLAKMTSQPTHVVFISNVDNGKILFFWGLLLTHNPLHVPLCHEWILKNTFLAKIPFQSSIKKQCLTLLAKLVLKKGSLTHNGTLFGAMKYHFNEYGSIKNHIHLLFHHREEPFMHSNESSAAFTEEPFLRVQASGHAFITIQLLSVKGPSVLLQKLRPFKFMDVDLSGHETFHKRYTVRCHEITLEQMQQVM